MEAFEFWQRRILGSGRHEEPCAEAASCDTVGLPLPRHVQGLQAGTLPMTQ